MKSVNLVYFYFAGNVQAYILQILQHLTTKLCNLVHLKMLFNTLAINSLLETFQTLFIVQSAHVGDVEFFAVRWSIRIIGFPTSQDGTFL